MCYNAAYDANRAFKKAIRDELNPEVRAELERKYEAWREQNPDIYREKHESQHASGRFFTSAFEHDAFPIIYSEQGQKTMDFFRWGLVPRWLSRGGQGTPNLDTNHQCSQRNNVRKAIISSFIP